MKYLASFVLTVFGMAIAITFSILVMINGWGLKPVSYGWIIGIGLIANATSLLIFELAKRITKNGSS